MGPMNSSKNKLINKKKLPFLAFPKHNLNSPFPKKLSFGNNQKFIIVSEQIV